MLKCLSVAVWFLGVVVYVFGCPALHGQEQTAAQDQILLERFSDNSTKKARIKPAGLAAKVGTAIDWQSDLDAAVKLAKATGRPLFWYVPTLNGTFMDRKDVVDQYMKAGPFSWPAIINLINDNFVPYRGVPDDEYASKYDLIPYRFVEPGFVVLEGGNLVQSADRLTTLHPRWLFQLIAHSLDDKPEWDALAGSRGRTEIKAAWSAYLQRQPLPEPDSVAIDDVMELKLLQGMDLYRAGKHELARRFWAQSASEHPDHPLAWKAAHESQGIGPFVRGFEVHGRLSDCQLQSGIASTGSSAPEGCFQEPVIWAAATEFLLDNQRKDGAYTDSDYDFGGADSLPNVHMAVTAICGWAMSNAIPHVSQARQSQLVAAVERAAKYCVNDQNLNARDREEILWAEAYRLRFLSHLHLQREVLAGVDLQTNINRIAKRLEDLQSGNGSWFHEYPNSFVTATALIALKDAQLAGAQIDTQRIDAGLARLASQQYSNGAYPYAVRRSGSRGLEPVEASAGRIPLCSYARFLWGKEDSLLLSTAAEIGLRYHDLLAKSLKYDNHTSTHAYGGFFFWYDMQSRTEAIVAIENPAQRLALASQQQRLIMNLPEIDGCFVDSHELGRCYGTAMALLSLNSLSKVIRPSSTTAP